MRIDRRIAYAALAVACAVPRLGVLVYERDAILSSYVEKSDRFALTFVQHGTYGFLPGEPSAYTQPLYGWFLIPIYWLFGRHWLSIGLCQIALAIGTAWIVYEIGRRVLGRRAALAAAAIATLQPYLIWHDVHVNREIVDQFCAAALVLLTLVVAERPSKRLAALLGIVAGLIVLGNVRMAFVPVLCALYLVARLPRAAATAALAAVVLGGAAVAIAPWLVRNRVEVGCWTIATDSLALWKANNAQTYGILRSGQWIDNVLHRPDPPPPNQWTPDEAYASYLESHALGYRRYPDECVAQSFYQRLTLRFWRQHPEEKAKLMLLSARFLWQPTVLETTGRQAAGTQVDLGRRLVEPGYMWTIYVLAVAGLAFVARPFAILALLLLGYNTVCALVFVGATRYRIAFDFLVALLATAALARAVRWVQERREPEAGRFRLQ